MNQKNKIAAIVLFSVTVLLAILAIIVSINLQRGGQGGEAPEGVEAADGVGVGQSCTPNDSANAFGCANVECEYPAVTYCTGVNGCQCISWSQQQGMQGGCDGDPGNACEPPACPSGMEDCGKSGDGQSKEGCEKQGSEYCTEMCSNCSNPTRIYRYCKQPVNLQCNDVCKEDPQCAGYPDQEIECDLDPSGEQGRCRNWNCPDEEDCICPVAPIDLYCGDIGCDGGGVCTSGTVCNPILGDYMCTLPPNEIDYDACLSTGTYQDCCEEPRVEIISCNETGCSDPNFECQPGRNLECLNDKCVLIGRDEQACNEFWDEEHCCLVPSEYVCGQFGCSGDDDCIDGTRCRDDVCMIENPRNYNACIDNPSLNNPDCCEQQINPVCGDGIVNQSWELCDENDDRFDGTRGYFSAGECRSPSQTDPCTYCGDGSVQTYYEECDDGNKIDTDGCSNQCLVIKPPECGNDECDQAGETCEYNPNNPADDKSCPGNQDLTNAQCRYNCTYCGDGILQPELGEECEIGDPGCNSNCLRNVTICGDNKCDPGETCDRNMRCSGAGVFSETRCRADCTYCGDGIVQAGEQCDDGNQVDGDGCNNSCQAVYNVPRCGDGVIDIYEEECEPSIPNSCGPGASCDPITCTCNPMVPGLCGSSCSSDIECPSNNVCYEGRCRLSICVPGATVFSAAIQYNWEPTYSAAGYATDRFGSVVCTPDGCNIVQCGTQCGVGGACPSGLACNAENRCVLAYCIDNYCKDECQLPGTAIERDEFNAIIIAMMLVVLGVLIYKIDVIKNGKNLLRAVGGNIVIAGFDKKEMKLILKKYKKKSSEKFEEKMLSEDEE